MSTQYIEDRLPEFLEKPITEEEKKHSKRIRECLKNKQFDELYEFLPKEIAKKINEKYRIIELQ